VKRRHNTAIGLIGATLVLVTATACSDTSDSGSSGSGSGNSTAAESAAVKDATALFDQYTQTQPDIEVPPLKSAPVTGKTLYILSCPVPGCVEAAETTADIAEQLGWKATVFTSDFAPEAYISTWNRMLESPPDAILYNENLPNSAIAPQLKKVKELGIPIVATGGSDTPDDVLKAAVNGPQVTTMLGKLMGAAVVADAQGPTDAVFVTDPNLELFNFTEKSVAEEIEGAGGSVDDLEISAGNVGQSVPGQVVTYLQANPDTKYVVFPVSDFLAGVPQALASAGISGVKLLSSGPAPADLAAVKAGEQWISVAFEEDASSYRAIDTLLRIFEGSDFDPEPLGWFQIMTKDNITQTSEKVPTPGSPDAFLNAWNVK
jgi:ABC-type sugar transport system substrate-binding protein